MNYHANLVDSLELLLYKDRSRDILSSQDEDVMQIYSGDLRAAIQGLHEFIKKYPGATTVIRNDPGIFEIKVFFLHKDPSENIRREKYVEARKRRYGR